MDDLRESHVADANAHHDRAVPQRGHAVCYLEYLPEVVGDENDPDAEALDLTENVKQTLDLMPRQGARWLV